MTGKREATTMSVREMREILGIKKTESYWLIKKHYFDTVKIAGRMRIVKKSFESWYANQIHYRKVQGEEPGIKLRSESYSAREIGEMLGITTSSVYDLIQHAKLKTVSVNYQLRVPRTVFETWYRSQNHYRNAQDRERDRMIEEASMTVPEMGRLLGIDRRAAWKLHTKAKAALVTIRVAGKPRITKESFEQWYQNQSEYVKVSALSKSSGQENTPNKDVAEKSFFPLKEAAFLLNTDDRDLYRRIQRHEIQGKKIGKQWYIRAEELQDMQKHFHRH